MMRLMKLLRLARVGRLVAKYEEQFAELMTTLKLGKLVVVIVVVGHWLSCLFFGVGSAEILPGDEQASAQAIHSCASEAFSN